MRRALYLLGGLTDHDIQWIASHAAKGYIPRGSVLIEEGVPIEALHIVLDGRLSVHAGEAGGKEIAALYAGDIVGEISFVDSFPPSASVTAIRDTHVLSISRPALSEKLAEDLGFAARFYREIAGFLATRLRRATGQLGYGATVEKVQDPDELDPETIGRVSIAATRFDDLLKHCRLPASEHQHAVGVVPA
jgi:CRP/FNR family cyclic AMP-dependent transcriptional regulator